ncbi:MAG: pyrrolo-quinoline quinone, partial [Planctomycetota bacterium]
KKLGTMQRASPLYVDGHIYTSTANGRWYILKPNGNSVDIVHRMRLNGEEVHGSPIVSHGRLYVPTTGALYCIGKPDHKPQADPRPEPPKESPVEDDPTPTHVQVVPVESLLRSGEKAQSQRFLVRLYNAKGQYLRTVDSSEVKFSIDGPGEIDASGKYAAPKEPVHAAVYVTARVGELTGQARIRVVPELPWEFTFDDGEVPITWVGARYRHIVIDFDLFQKLTAANPMAGQLYIFLMSEFINSGRQTLKYDISTPAQKRTQLLRFVDLEDSVKTLDDAKKATGPALDLLKQEGVLKNWEWSLPKDAPENEYALTVQRGDRGVTGNGVMVKITTIPKGTRSQAWMGHTHFHDYTIEADVMGAEKHGKLPDIGLIGQRYTIDLMGASQQLQIRTWPPQLRMAKTVPFQWKANTWYRLKMRCSVEDGKAVLRGKAWVRGTPEPKEWLVEAVDESPNVQGSPGLYGNAKDAEIFYDNIRVYYND